jgi:hypothetical protein
MDDDLQCKMTFTGRRAPIEDYLQWKTTSNGRQPPIEDDLQWKTTSNGRRPPMEDDLKILKVEYLSNCLLDHTKILNLGLYDQIILVNLWIEDDLKWKTTSKY